MKKNVFTILFSCTIAVILAGCGRTIIVSEVLQEPADSRIYTAYNIWYEKPDSVSSDNALKGKIIPFGTEVDILSATSKKIVFKTVEGKQEFTLKYDDSVRMQTPEDFIRNLFTTNSRRNLEEGVTPVNLEKISRGLVDKGMTKQEVRLAYGPPCKNKTPDETACDTWIYWTDYIVFRRVVFNNNKVIDVIELK